MKKTFPVLLGVLLFVVAMAMMPVKDENPVHKYSVAELEKLHNQVMATPLAPGEFFLEPSECKGCHGFDSLAQANVDPNGNDVNLYDDWETSMMGLAGIDPLWRAKVSHEILVNPSHSSELQHLCTSCHAPMGHYTAFFKNNPPYSLANLDTDALGKAGVACMGCHSIGNNLLGSVFTGNIPYDTNRFIYGPFVNPMTGPMQLYVGLTPVFGGHMSESKACSPCHTLISNTVDLNGVPTGGVFVEQATFHEWKNSDYPAQPITCQNCHMPQLEDPVVIANGNIGLAGRSPFNLHSFAGANSFMVNLIKNNKTSLGVGASDANFDSTLVAINKQLTQHTLNLVAQIDTILNDTISVSVELTNKAGHKFPSGYPSRRAVLQFLITKPNGDTLFASGVFDSTQEVVNISAPFENHYDTITNSSQVQIYEMVMADVNGDKTTVLERSASKIKDNRIPPLGFTTTHQAYDTCQIVGGAFTDPDFNKLNSVEGTGKDIVHYRIGLNGYNGLINVSASVYYQTVPPGWLSEMFSFNSARIDTFRNMFNNADQSPILIANQTLTNVLITTGLNSLSYQTAIEVFPTITKDGKISIKGKNVLNSSLSVYNDRGQLMKFAVYKREDQIELQLPDASGIYFIHISNPQIKITKKVFKL